MLSVSQTQARPPENAVRTNKMYHKVWNFHMAFYVQEEKAKRKVSLHQELSWLSWSVYQLPSQSASTTQHPSIFYTQTLWKLTLSSSHVILLIFRNEKDIIIKSSFSFSALERAEKVHNLKTSRNTVQEYFFGSISKW